MSFVDSFLVSEIFISAMIIFTLYYLFFSQKNKFKHSRKTLVVFSIILFIFLQHIIFEVLKYFLYVGDIAFFRTIANLIFIPLAFFLFFYVKKNVDYKLWFSVVAAYGFSVVFVGIGWFHDILLIDFFATSFKIVTSILFYVLVVEFLMKKE